MKHTTEPRRNLLCLIVGHKPRTGKYDGSEYLRVDGSVIVDGIGRYHATLAGRCLRCEQWYRVGQFHLPANRLKP